MKKIKFTILLLSFMLLSLASCGGSDGNNGNNNDSPLVDLKTSVVRDYTPDDTWTYAVVIANNDGSYTYGTAVYTILPDLVISPAPLGQKECLDLEIFYDYGGNPPSITSHRYLLQDLDGALRVHGEDNFGDERWTTIPSEGYLLYESPMEVGQSAVGNTAFNNGESDPYPYEVMEIENVNVPFGNFEAYRIQKDIETDIAEGITETITDWYVPGLGLVKRVHDINYYDNENANAWFASSTETITLESTSVAY